MMQRKAVLIIERMRFVSDDRVLYDEKFFPWNKHNTRIR